MRTIVRTAAAEAAYQRYLGSLENFAEVYEAIEATLAEDPGKGWRTVGGRWEYLLAQHEKPRVRAIYSFDEDEVTISELEASGGMSSNEIPAGTP